MKKLLFLSLFCIATVFSTFAQSRTAKRDRSVKVFKTDGAVVEGQIDYWRAKFDVNYIDVITDDKVKRIKKKHIAKFVTRR